MGAGLCILQVDQRPALRDIDEAAWISNGRFFDLFVEGKTQDPAWWAFDRYAHRPPIGNYVVGLVLHAVGEPWRRWSLANTGMSTTSTSSWRPLNTRPVSPRGSRLAN